MTRKYREERFSPREVESPNSQHKERGIGNQRLEVSEQGTKNEMALEMHTGRT